MDIQQCLQTWPVLAELKPELCNQFVSFVVIKSTGVLAITRDDKVLQYTNGCLEELVKLRAKTIGWIRCGWNYQLALARNGQLWAWGENQYGQCGDGACKIIARPKKIQLELDSDQVVVSAVRCGVWHSVALTREGQVYCWGRNQHGQCGVGTKQDVDRPVKVIILEEMVIGQIECGGSHTLALTNTGQVFAWGRNQSGQLAIGKDADQTVPVRVTIAGCDQPIKQIACGHDYSLLLTERGLVFGCGDNQRGQVGCRSTTTLVYQALLIDCPNLFNSIAIYRRQSVARCQNGFCFVWGLIDEQPVRKPRQTVHSCQLAAIGDHIKECPLQIDVSPRLRSTCPHPSSSSVMCVSARLSSSFNQPDSSDLEFVVQGESIYAHRSILRISSLYMRRLLSSLWSSTDRIELDPNSYSYPVYLSYLRFLYTDCVEIDPQHLPELLDLSNSYLESSLRVRCIELLSSSISLSNCCDLYLLSLQYELPEFSDFVLQFMAGNVPEIYRTTGFQQMESDQSKKLVIRLGAHDKFPL